ncbi:site-specific DNA-methyltransferase [Shewanella frigidimarina]|uniref:site-specific DNA-methyltransferase n=1 Tax=Shewanella frigidimarina TaxID=56812 RepID=UPI003D79D975
MTDKPEVMSGESLDIVAQRCDQLKQLFPGVFTETKDANGKVVSSIDFERLKAELGNFSDIYEGRRERYGMEWPGKRDCMKIIQEPSRATLKPCPDESVDWDTTKNLFIEGDNLEVLKLLQKSYYGKVKMIYVDPPYNTGNEFIYPDNYQETLDTYLAYAGLVDDEGKKFTTNTTSEGRFHSKWMNMIFPRLYLARNLLQDDGVICISINDKELYNLRQIIDQIFGEENFIATLVWEKGRKNDAKRVSVGHEYMVLYAKNLAFIEEITQPWREPKEGIQEIIDIYNKAKKDYPNQFDKISEELIAFYKSLEAEYPSKKYARSRFVDQRGIWRDNNISWPGGGGPKYDLIHPITGKPCKVPDDGWRFIETTMKQKIQEGYIHFRDDHTQPPILKSYLYIDPESSGEDEEAGGKKQVMGSVFYRHSQPSNDVIKELFGDKVFENPKDHEILARLIEYCTSDDDIILDFFAGSGSTAHAVFDLNRKNSSNRKFIAVQLPEPTPEGSLARAQELFTIADLSKARIRKASAKIQNSISESSSIDLGFKVFKLAPSTFVQWKPDNVLSESGLQHALELYVDNSHDCSSDEKLFELLLKAGFELTTKIEKLDINGKGVYSVANHALLICLEDQLTAELIDAVIALEPMQFICLDKGFQGNDQLKANTAQAFKARSQDSEAEMVFKVV